MSESKNVSTAQGTGTNDNRTNNETLAPGAAAQGWNANEEATAEAHAEQRLGVNHSEAVAGTTRAETEGKTPAQVSDIIESEGQLKDLEENLMGSLLAGGDDDDNN